MPQWLPSIPYPPAGQHGFWDPVTSTLNWCEEDYYVTPYSAEIVNTMTNLMFMYLAYKGIRNCITQKHDTVFVVSYLGYLIVGTGSFLFHSTLKYPWQLVDELSMIYTTCIMFFASFTRNRGTAFSTILAISLASLSIFITAYYHYVKDPVFHQISYGLLTAGLFFRSLYVMETGIRPKGASSTNVTNGHANGSANGHTNGSAKSSAEEIEQKRQDDRDRDIVKTMWSMIPIGLGIFLGGFALWGLDNAYCSNLKVWRREIGLPWGILLEGHGWWHLMTGIGAYYYIVWGIWLRYCLNGQQDQVKLVWPSMFFSVPEVVKVDASGIKTNGHINGHANGHANGSLNGSVNGKKKN